MTTCNTDDDLLKSISAYDSSSEDTNNKEIQSFVVSDECWQAVQPKRVIHKWYDPDIPNIHTNSRKRLPKSKWTNILIHEKSLRVVFQTQLCQ